MISMGASSIRKTNPGGDYTYGESGQDSPAQQTITNWPAACVREKVPVVTATSANRKATSAVASFTRLSPSRMVIILRGKQHVLNDRGGSEWRRAVR